MSPILFQNSGHPTVEGAWFVWSFMFIQFNTIFIICWWTGSLFIYLLLLFPLSVWWLHQNFLPQSRDWEDHKPRQEHPENKKSTQGRHFNVRLISDLKRLAAQTTVNIYYLVPTQCCKEHWGEPRRLEQAGRQWIKEEGVGDKRMRCHKSPKSTQDATSRYRVQLLTLSWLYPRLKTLRFQFQSSWFEFSQL